MINLWFKQFIVDSVYCFLTFKHTVYSLYTVITFFLLAECVGRFQAVLIISIIFDITPLIISAPFISFYFRYVFSNLKDLSAAYPYWARSGARAFGATVGSWYGSGSVKIIQPSQLRDTAHECTVYTVNCTVYIVKPTVITSYFSLNDVVAITVQFPKKTQIEELIIVV
jgi:hypothetical protein